MRERKVRESLSSPFALPRAAAAAAARAPAGRAIRGSPAPERRRWSCPADEVFAAARARSRLYGDAVREYIARHSAESITESLDRVCDAVSSGGEFARAAARRTLERSDW